MIRLTFVDSIPRRTHSTTCLRSSQSRSAARRLSAVKAVSCATRLNAATWRLASGPGSVDARCSCHSRSSSAVCFPRSSDVQESRLQERSRPVGARKHAGADRECLRSKAVGTRQPSSRAHCVLAYRSSSVDRNPPKTVPAFNDESIASTDVYPYVLVRAKQLFEAHPQCGKP